MVQTETCLHLVAQAHALPVKKLLRPRFRFAVFHHGKDFSAFCSIVPNQFRCSNIGPAAVVCEATVYDS